MPSTSAARATLTWLAELRHLWICICGVAVALTACLANPTESCIRLTGCALQLLGVGTAAWGISETRALFGHPTLVGRLSKWWSRRPRPRRGQVINAAASACAMSSTTGARAHVTHPVSGEPTLQNLAESISENVRLIHERITRTGQEIDRESDRREVALREERRSREEADATIRRQLESTATGGFHISAIGATWLFLGVILGSASVEVSRALS
jgi:hypothetical protein